MMKPGCTRRLSKGRSLGYYCPVAYPFRVLSDAGVNMFKNLLRTIARPFSRRRGAVTADFVVLTAGVIIIFLLIVQPVYDGSRSMISDINDKLAEHASTVWQF